MRQPFPRASTLGREPETCHCPHTPRTLVHVVTGGPSVVLRWSVLGSGVGWT